MLPRIPTEINNSTTGTYFLLLKKLEACILHSQCFFRSTYLFFFIFIVIKSFAIVAIYKYFEN